LKPQTWLFLLLVSLLLLLRAQPLYAAGLRNLAVLRLYPLWLEQAEPILDPPCRALGAFSDLEQMFQPSIALGNAHGWTYLGRVLWLQARCVEAVDAWERAWTIARDQTAAFELIRVARYAVFDSEMRRTFAEQIYRYAVSLAEIPNDQLAYLWLGRSFDLMPQRKNADRLTLLASKMASKEKIADIWQRLANSFSQTDATHWWAVGKLYGMENKWEQAALAYEQGIGLSIEPYDFLIEAGRSWEYAQKWDRAEIAYRQAYQVRSDGVEACLGLGTVYRAKGRYQEALDWYLRAEQIWPQSLLAHLYLGITYYQMKDYELARKHLETALVISPEHHTGMYYLALVSYDEGDRLLAETQLAKAIHYNPKPPYSWWMQLGDWRTELRDCSGAREAYASSGNAGASALLVQQKMAALSKVCGP
jgi:tetratricopeptide (TPR) repeat protein